MSAPESARPTQPEVPAEPTPAMTLHPCEPAAGPWRTVDLDGLLALVVAGPAPEGRPRVVAVDGRGGAGKSTLASALAGAVPGAVVLHTDDLAWHEPFFGWTHLLREALETVHRGEGLSMRPPAWEAKGRTGRVEIPAGTPLLVVEGNAASPRDLAGLADVVCWVQSDFAECERRGIARDVAEGANGDVEEATRFWHEWMGHELRWFENDRPWERADLVVAGTPPHAPGGGRWAVADGPLAPSSRAGVTRLDDTA